jgi:hypothetical protein
MRVPFSFEGENGELGSLLSNTSREHKRPELGATKKKTSSCNYHFKASTFCALIMARAVLNGNN